MTLIQNTSLNFASLQNTQSGKNEEPSDQKFQSLLTTSEGEPPKRPNMAQFMAVTGASAQEARNALYVHKNWQHYLPDWEGGLDTSSAQNQIKEELAGGVRSIENKWSAPQIGGGRVLDAEYIGGTSKFQPLAGPMEGAVGGAIEPTFFNSPGTKLHEQLNAFRITRPDGTFATTIMPHNHAYGSNDPMTPFGVPLNPSETKERFAANVYAFGLGQDALDDFAVRLGAANWAELDWRTVQDMKQSPNPLTKPEWLSGQS